MEDILNKVKEHAVWAKDEAAKLGKQVYAKTNVVLSKTKISFAISETENKIKDVYAEIGKAVYEKYSAGEEICDFAKEMCEGIDALVKEKDDLKEKLNEFKETVKCSECGKDNDTGSLYCAKCGAKLSVNMKNGDIEFNSEPITVYSDFSDDSSEGAEVIDDEDAKIKRVVTIKSKKSE